MRDRILEVLNRCDKALTIYEVSEELGVSSVSDIEALCDELRKLEDLLFIILIKINICF